MYFKWITQENGDVEKLTTQVKNHKHYFHCKDRTRPCHACNGLLHKCYSFYQLFTMGGSPWPHTNCLMQMNRGHPANLNRLSMSQFGFCHFHWDSTIERVVHSFPLSIDLTSVSLEAYEMVYLSVILISSVVEVRTSDLYPCPYHSQSSYPRLWVSNQPEKRT